MERKIKRILVADDELDILELISYHLTNEGYFIYTAKDGNEALDLSRKFHPHLIILDIMMPFKNGMEVCQILRSSAEFRDTLIIFLTALNDENAHIKGLESGADDFISKPISMNVLVSRVNALFRRTTKENGQAINIGPLTIDPMKFM